MLTCASVVEERIAVVVKAAPFVTLADFDVALVPLHEGASARECLVVTVVHNRAVHLVVLEDALRLVGVLRSAWQRAYLAELVFLPVCKLFALPLGNVQAAQTHAHDESSDLGTLLDFFLELAVVLILADARLVINGRPILAHQFVGLLPEHALLWVVMVKRVSLSVLHFDQTFVGHHAFRVDHAFIARKTPENAASARAGRRALAILILPRYRLGFGLIRCFDS